MEAVPPTITHERRPCHARLQSCFGGVHLRPLKPTAQSFFGLTVVPLDARVVPRNFDDIYVLIFQYVGIGSDSVGIRWCWTRSFTLRGRCSSAWRSVVSSAGKTRRHLPKAHLLTSTSNRLLARLPSRGSKLGVVEGVTSLTVLPTGSAVGLKERTPSLLCRFVAVRSTHTPSREYRAAPIAAQDKGGEIDCDDRCGTRQAG